MFAQSVMFLVAVAIAVVPTTMALPMDTLLVEYLQSLSDTKLTAVADDLDYDLHYDQRQKGSENYRLNVDGLMVAVPAAADTTIGALGDLATEYLLDLAAATSELDGDDDDQDDYVGGGGGAGYGEAGGDVDPVDEEDDASGGQLQPPEEPAKPQQQFNDEKPYKFEQIAVVGKNDDGIEGDSDSRKSGGLLAGEMRRGVAAAGSGASLVAKRGSGSGSRRRGETPVGSVAAFVPQSRNQPRQPAKKRNK